MAEQAPLRGVEIGKKSKRTSSNPAKETGKADHGVQQGCTHPRPSGLELCLVIARKMREESSEQSCRNLAHP